LSSYIHLNPVRAGLARHPGAYRWSSARYYVKDAAPQWLETMSVLGQFSEEIDLAKKQYRQFMSGGGYDQETAMGFVRGTEREPRIFGNDEFVANMEAKAGRTAGRGVNMQDLIRETCKLWELREEQLVAPGRERYRADARAMLAHAVRETEGANLSTLAEIVGRDITTVSQSAQRWCSLMTKNDTYRARYELFLKSICR